MSIEQVQEFLSPIFYDKLHKKRLDSLGNAVLGTIESASLSISAIGRGLAAARCLTEKHAIKQIDRLLSNPGFDVWELSRCWSDYILKDETEIYINLDWTDFDADNQTTIFAGIQTSHGRSVPLLWKTVSKTKLKNRRNQFEDDLLVQLREIIPQEMTITIVADRGFADQKLFDFLTDLGFHYIIRTKSNTKVGDSKGRVKKAIEWVGKSGRMRVIKNGTVTADECQVNVVVCVKDKGMKDAWILVSSRSDLSGSQIKKRYGKRFSIEETFRDFKNLRMGMGLSSVRVRSPKRRDRLLFLAQLAHALLSVLGLAGEKAGIDRLLKSNTSKKRVLSLFRQGARWYVHLPGLREDRLILLMTHFDKLVKSSPGLLKIIHSA